MTKLIERLYIQPRLRSASMGGFIKFYQSGSISDNVFFFFFFFFLGGGVNGERIQIPLKAICHLNGVSLACSIMAKN